MRKEKQIELNSFIPILAAYDVNHWRSPQENFDIIWDNFKKTCNRNRGIISRHTLKEIEDRGWMSPTQAQKFCDYAGLEYLK